MASGLPCPNPSCTHVFTHAEVKGADSLRCPRCGHLFQLRTPTKTAAGVKSISVQPAVQPVPVRKEPARASFQPGLAFQVPPAQSSARPAPRTRVVLLVALGIALAVVSPVVYFAVSHWSSQPADPSRLGPVHELEGMVRNLSQKSELAFRLHLPKDVWKPATDLKQNLGAVVAVRRAEPEVWLAVAVRDFGSRKPRDAELLAEALDRLGNHFGDRVAFGPKPEASELAGQPAQRLEFKGTHNSVTWRGECHMLGYQGLGYWLFVAASELATAQQQLTDLHKEPGQGLVLASARRGWTEQPPEIETFRAAGLAFDVKGPKGVWLGGFDARTVDDHGVLYLHGRDLKEKDPTRKNIKSALVLVTALEKMLDADAALKAARAQLEEKVQVDSYKMGLADEKPTPETALGIARKFGTNEARLIELCLSINDEPKRFVVLAVVPLAERAYVFRCECAWEYRQAWRSDFIELLGTLRVHTP
jgi:hypothetical protein